MPLKTLEGDNTVDLPEHLSAWILKYKGISMWDPMFHISYTIIPQKIIMDKNGKYHIVDENGIYTSVWHIIRLQPNYNLHFYKQLSNLV